MKRKTTWVFIGITFTFWFGCAGENQNYRINEQTTPLLEEGYPTQAPGATQGPSVKSEPSVTGLDRSHWPKLAVGSSRGTVAHYPRYFTRDCCGKSWYTFRDRPSPLYLHPASAETEILAATADSTERLSKQEAVDFVAAPVKFAWDLGTLPLRALAEDNQPWDTHYSPED